ncbi:excalibur calcium-binding domain-containing protein [Motilibacter peucedani]|uniref:Excalibur calcium-binding domain-containing protein n=1 Tax=Motilibacter peucedani TaxID=598650 RepID=A0A420XTA7_9ACTN|nr:excalibur calcium-binding domain-containing protein [Motilibacter peucedani]RKS80065.1 excalibur calcium-binding domain-containing protein [Motilibacter peucedani]
MKRIVVTAAAAGMVAAGLVAAGPAEASPRTFANCTALNAVYKGGVARPGAVDKRKGGGHAKHRPVYDRALYNANTKSDRDHDGIACEK